MKTLIQAVAATVVVAVPAFAQEATSEAGAALEALTCGEFVALSDEDQMTVMLAMRAHMNGVPLPDTPLPIGADAGSGEAAAAEADTGASADADASGEAEAEESAEAAKEEMAPGDGDEAQAEEGASGATEARLSGMRTSCEEADVLAMDAMRAAHADYD